MTGGKKLRLVASLLAACAAVAPPRAARPQTTAPDAANVARRDLEQLAAQLNDASARQEQRDEAARRLVSRQSPEARQLLANALVDLLNQGGQLAAARALAEDPDPDPGLINPLFAAIGGRRDLTEAAARALANYKGNPEVLSRLIALVQRRPPLSETIRIAIIRSIGSLVEKRAAAFLVELLRSGEETTAVHAAAADALADLTGIGEYGQDAQQWDDWWAQNAGKSDADFRNDLLPRRSARYDQIRLRYTQLTAELETILDDQYQSAPAPQRSEVLLRYLKSGEPEVRAVGARIIYLDALDNKAVPPVARDQLRPMIGDSSAKVRAAVAEALSQINDPAALEPLLAQFEQETEAPVKAAIARALAPINDLRAVPALLKALNDPSYTAARAAAEAIEQLGPKILESDPALARRAAQELRETLRKRTGGIGTTELREALVDAMVPLKQEELLPTLYGLLDERRGETPEIRRLALKAIGEIGSPQSASIILDALNDKKKESQRVRLEAVRALGKLPNAADFFETLRQRMYASEEPDASVREEAWRVLQSILPMLPKEQLVNLADRFRRDGDLQQELIVRQALAEQLLKLKMEDELATQRQSIGEVLMQLNQPEKAAEYFKLALDYRRTQNVPGVVIIGLMEQRMRALLQARQYAEAVAFAAEAIRENANNQQQMGSAIRQEADRLRMGSAGDLESALQLIRESRKMNPPLPTQYREQLDEIETDIKKRQEVQDRNRGAGSTAPENASRPASPGRVVSAGGG